MQCGVACLAMICRHYGMSYSLEQLSALCTPTTEGVSLKAISDAAHELGLETVSARVPESQLTSLPLPCILHWNQNHFVVLYKIDRDGRRFHIADPGKGRYTLTREELDSHWISIRNQGEPKGIACMLRPGDEFGKVISSISSSACSSVATCSS